MCGGIVSTLTMSLPRAVRGRLGTQLPYQLAYNAGRVTGYTLAGALMGGLGTLLLQAVPLQHAQRALYGIAAVFMIALGLYLGGWWRGLALLERIGTPVWRRLEPLGRRLVPVREPLAGPGSRTGVGLDPLRTRLQRPDLGRVGGERRARGPADVGLRPRDPAQPAGHLPAGRSRRTPGRPGVDAPGGRAHGARLRRLCPLATPWGLTAGREWPSLAAGGAYLVKNCWLVSALIALAAPSGVTSIMNLRVS